MRPAESDVRSDRHLRIGAAAIVIAGLGLGIVRLVTQFAYGFDFDVYRAAGRAVVQRQSLFGPWIGQHLTHPLPFTYPPLAAVFAVPFALIPPGLGYLLWTAASIVVLAFVVRASTGELRTRFRGPGTALLVTLALALALAPVQEELRYGQVGIVLMAMCLFDCMPAPTRLPRGVLVGLATAIKLVPGIFIPYLWLTGRRKAAGVAVATFAIASAAGATLTAGDSKSFWTSRVFDNSRVGDLGYISNQSLNGMVVRALGSHAVEHVLWFAAAALIAVFGLRQAARASRAGDELLGIALCALVGLLVSPVSWIHHLVWVVPALAVLVGAATDRRRVVVAATIAALFTLRLPYLALSIPAGLHISWIAAVLRDSDGICCIALLWTLSRMVPRAPEVVSDRA